ncbi:hypothetical protein CBS101457_006078 [Exobasidium rhododendri]|nr:hypothetical protein CBS101457_006078 [Exobasidium rhododendri]
MPAKRQSKQAGSHSVDLGNQTDVDYKVDATRSGLLSNGAGYDVKADLGLEKKEAGREEKAAELSTKDMKAIALLVVLYLLQGIPVGLAFGTMPFLLKARLSYSDIGIFMLATYPYSLKLLWSPVVDSCYVNKWRVPFLGTTLRLGRRKSWIVPIQLIVGVLLYLLGLNVDRLLLVEKPNVYLITSLFFTLVLFAATQDIAVDGWALTLLSQENLSYASTAQTIGLNTGYFMSFTVFLAFNSVEFGNKYIRSVALASPILSLNAYLQISAAAYIIVTLWLLFFKMEDEEVSDNADMDLKSVYAVMMRICRLKHVQTFIIVHLVAKIGFQANDAVTGLKLVEKGFGKEDLALTVLIDFPFQIVLGYLAARWSKGENALRPWLIGYVARLGFAMISMAIVAGFPTASTIPTSYFILIAVTTVTSSFASTVQFVGVSAFHTQIADPLIGGTYMTLLNTVSNLGGTWPRPLVLKSVDYFTISRCSLPVVKESVSKVISNTIGVVSSECTSDDGKAQCRALGGTCVIERDGYYWTSAICVVVGTIVLFTFIRPKSKQLQALPAAAWRVSLEKSHSN